MYKLLYRHGGHVMRCDSKLLIQVTATKEVELGSPILILSVRQDGITIGSYVHTRPVRRKCKLLFDCTGIEITINDLTKLTPSCRLEYSIFSKPPNYTSSHRSAIAWPTVPNARLVAELQ